MKLYGAFEVEQAGYAKHMANVSPEALKGATIDEAGARIVKDGKVLAVITQGQPRTGFATPSRRLELFSPTMDEWGWPEHALPGYIKSHIHPERLDRTKNECVLVPTFRLPNLIHSRSGNAKWLVEIAHRNPIWIHTSDAERLGLKTGDLLKVVTDIGHFVDKVWVTEAIKPGVVACSHHIGRWRLPSQETGNRWATNTVDIREEAPGRWRMIPLRGIEPFASGDPDSARIFWRDGGVHQNITHAVHPDPISGMHCWHQRVRLERPGPGEDYGHILVDTNRSFQVYKDWLAMTRAPQRADGLRRPLGLNRPLRPAEEAFYKRS
jgi:anaerobic selenocysteine-containing dehydrogenase